MVAIVVVLAATVSIAVLGFTDDLSETSPTVSFSASEQGNQIVFTHRGGDVISNSTISVLGAKWWSASAENLRAGDRIIVSPGPGIESIQLISNDGQQSAILATATVTQPTQNLVINPGFERGIGTDADLWEQSDTSPEGKSGLAVQRSDERSLTGGFSMKQRDTTSNYARTFTSVSVGVEGNIEYVFGGSYYLEDPKTGVSASDYRYAVRIRWFDAQGNFLEETSKFDDFTTFSSWEEVRFNADASSGATTARLRIEAKGPPGNETDVFWDQMFIEESE